MVDAWMIQSIYVYLCVYMCMLLNHTYDFTLLLAGYLRVSWQFVIRVSFVFYCVLESKCRVIYTPGNCSTTEVYCCRPTKFFCNFYRFNRVLIPHMRHFLKMQLKRKAYIENETINQAWWHISKTLEAGRAKQEDCNIQNEPGPYSEFQVILGYDCLQKIFF